MILRDANGALHPLPVAFKSTRLFRKEFPPAGLTVVHTRTEGCRPPGLRYRRHPLYSHSIVPGGLLVTSYTTRLTPLTSLMMRVATRPMKPMSKG
jgi:hypothetical protein